MEEFASGINDPNISNLIVKIARPWQPYQKGTAVRIETDQGFCLLDFKSVENVESETIGEIVKSFFAKQ